MFQLFVIVCVAFASVARGQMTGDSEWPNYGNDPGRNALLATLSDQPRECVKAEGRVGISYRGHFGWQP